MFFRAYRASSTGEDLGVWQGLVVSLYRHRDGYFLGKTEAQMRAFGEETASSASSSTRASPRATTNRWRGYAMPWPREMSHRYAN
jgi:hypothetical protein